MATGAALFAVLVVLAGCPSTSDVSPPSQGPAAPRPETRNEGPASKPEPAASETPPLPGEPAGPSDGAGDTVPAAGGTPTADVPASGDGTPGETPPGPPEINGFAYLETTRSTASGQTLEIPRYRHEITGLVFRRLPGGTFEMGSPPTERDRFGDEGPVRRVAVAPFLLGETECTQAAWDLVAERTPLSDGRGRRGPDLPMEGVSWLDIQPFLRETGLRLPTEAEWEYACRAGTGTRFVCGDDDKTLGEFAWHSGNSSGQTHPVRERLTNAFGLFDMHGNVWEWCQDTYQASYAGAPDAAYPGWEAAGARHRVFRGGSFYGEARHCRSADRYRREPDLRFPNLGFRPALTVP